MRWNMPVNRRLKRGLTSRGLVIWRGRRVDGGNVHAPLMITGTPFRR